MAGEIPSVDSASRNSEEFVRLLTCYNTRIYLFILSLLPNHSDADEVLQETNLLLWRKFREFRPGTDFRAWAFQVAFHKVQEFLNKQQHDRLRFSDEFLSAVAEDEFAAGDDMDRRQSALVDCMGRLSESDRRLIQLRYQLGATIAAIGAETGRSLDAAYKAVGRVRRALHDCIHRKLATEDR
jgi:RNA polymerase sigma-70 factor (ECF subfamily)